MEEVYTLVDNLDLDDAVQMSILHLQEDHNEQDFTLEEIEALITQAETDLAFWSNAKAEFEALLPEEE
jgi:hypothetical protein